MAYIIQMQLIPMWVPDGAGSAVLGQNQANFSGFGTTFGPGPVGNAQSMTLLSAEVVPGGDSPTQGNFNTAMTNAVSDLTTKMGTVGGNSGESSTPLAIIQGWSTGNP